MTAVDIDVTAVTPGLRTEEFARRLSYAMNQLDTRSYREETLKDRVSRRFPKREVAELLGVDHKFLDHVAKGDEDVFPEGQRSGRELSFTPGDICLIRALMGSKTHLKRQHIHWRKPGEPLKVVTFGAQKGGTGKSLSAAHFAQYLVLAYGLRVGVIDSDPQSTASLYFAGDSNHVFDPDTKTLADFMGVETPGAEAPTPLSSEDLEGVWQPTPWPGVRLIPGGANILNADVSLFFMARGTSTKVYRILKDSLAKWEEAHPPVTTPMDLRREDGSFDTEAYHRALNETLDVVIIDQQPSITLMQLNGVVAADTLVVPMTMKGFDLSTLTTYSASLQDFLDFVVEYDPEIVLGPGGHIVLPTIVQSENEKDVSQISDLVDKAGDIISEVWYDRSAAVANASEQYMSIYEYTPPEGRKASARTFTRNANAVNDHIVTRALPHLPSRGFAEEFIRERWGEEQ